MSRRMVEQFLEMVKIDSESGNEARMMEYLLTACAELGGNAVLDDYGNLIARFEARGCQGLDAVLLSCHADTVKPGVGIEPVIVDGVIRSKGNTILGADDKAGIAEILEALRSAEVMPPVELAVSRQEEIGLFGRDALVANGLDSVESKAFAGTAMAVFYAIFNGIGRIVWGAIADRIGTKKSLMAMFSFQALMMFTIFQLGGNEYTLYLAAALIGFNFGGNFSLFPTTTAEFFGTKTVGQNYGYVFTAYGIGGVVGPMMAGYFKDAGVTAGVDAWYPAFIIAGVLCLVAVFLAFKLEPPKAPRRRKVKKSRK